MPLKLNFIFIINREGLGFNFLNTQCDSIQKKLISDDKDFSIQSILSSVGKFFLNSKISAILNKICN